MVVSNQRFGEYYGIQGMTWRYPPILDDPHQTVQRNGRELMVYRDGRSVRLVAWRTKRGVYWVRNTLTQSLSADEDGRDRRLAAPARPLVPWTAVP